MVGVTDLLTVDGTVEKALIGESLDEETIETAAGRATDDLEPALMMDDLQASGEFRAQLLEVYTERALEAAIDRAERMLWLNPLVTAPSDEPTARGMAAAVPYLDGLFAFAGPDDIAELARQLRQMGAGGRIGYGFDARSNRQTTT